MILPVLSSFENYESIERQTVKQKHTYRSVWKSVVHSVISGNKISNCKLSWKSQGMEIVLSSNQLKEAWMLDWF